MKNRFYVKIALILISCLILLSGCTQASAEMPIMYNYGNTFTVIDLTVDWHVVYCNKTKVMYVVSMGSYNKGNFTLLVNPDGTPMIWENSY